MAVVRYAVDDNIYLKSDKKVHAVHPLEKNFTMCGIAHVDYDNEVSITTKDKISCKVCVAMIDYCKSIKEKDINRDWMQKV